MASILLIEDHTGFALALQRYLTLDPDLEIAAIVRSGEDALKKLPELKVDLALVDVSLPTMSGIDLVQQVHTEFPQVRCLMLSGHKMPEYVRRSRHAGARGYVLKDDANGILEGIHWVLGGKIYVSPALQRYE
jgi:DNA-binding NarL/FixJ family response regulator